MPEHKVRAAAPETLGHLKARLLDHAYSTPFCQMRRDLQNQEIYYGLEDLDPVERAAIHELSWVVVRKASNTARENCGFESCIWSVLADEDIKDEDFLAMRRLVQILNRRNKLRDYLHATASEEAESGRNDIPLRDGSSPLAITVKNRHHDVDRFQDDKWLLVQRLSQAFTALLMRAIIVHVWVYSRSPELLNIVSKSSHTTIQSANDEMKRRGSNWKQKLHPRSRDYSINSANLTTGSPRCIWRACSQMKKLLGTKKTEEASGMLPNSYAKLLIQGPF